MIGGLWQRRNMTIGHNLKGPLWIKSIGNKKEGEKSAES